MTVPTSAAGSHTRQSRLRGPSPTIDHRTHAFRHDLADASLAVSVVAPRYADPLRLACVRASTPVYDRPGGEMVAVSALLAGETFDAIDMSADWAWGQCTHDGYVGWVRRAALGTPPAAPASHRVAAAIAPIFCAPDIKRAVAGVRYLGSPVSGTLDGNFLALDGGGFLHRRHVAPAATFATDWIAVARQLTGTPYVWGGRAASGIDCSGLVQVAMAACGIAAPRDSDQQRAAFAASEGGDAGPGDIVFFPGHVGIMVDGERLLHANAYWMTTLVEPLAAVTARLAGQHPRPILGVGRPVLPQLSVASTTCLPATTSL